MWVKQKTVKGIFQKSGESRRADVVIRVQVGKEIDSTVSLICGDVAISVPRSVLFKVTGGKLNE